MSDEPETFILPDDTVALVRFSEGSLMCIIPPDLGLTPWQLGDPPQRPRQKRRPVLRWRKHRGSDRVPHRPKAHVRCRMAKPHRLATALLNLVGCPQMKSPVPFLAATPFGLEHALPSVRLLRLRLGEVENG